jgi:hypothetical protein
LKRIRRRLKISKNQLLHKNHYNFWYQCRIVEILFAFSSGRQGLQVTASICWNRTCCWTAVVCTVLLIQNLGKATHSRRNTITLDVSVGLTYGAQIIKVQIDCYLFRPSDQAYKYSAAPIKLVKTCTSNKPWIIHLHQFWSSRFQTKIYIKSNAAALERNSIWSFWLLTLHHWTEGSWVIINLTRVNNNKSSLRHSFCSNFWSRHRIDLKVKRLDPQWKAHKNTSIARPKPMYSRWDIEIPMSSCCCCCCFNNPSRTTMFPMSDENRNASVRSVVEST